jgi:cyanophycin synthetase
MDGDDQEALVIRLNARDTVAFDLGNLTYYPGPNLYLPRRALVFDLAITGGPPPLPVADYVAAVAGVYPQLTGTGYPDHAHLFAGVVSVVSRLNIDLRLDRFAVHARGRFDRVAIQALDRRTQHQAIYFVWDWLEAIGAGQPFDHAGRIARLQAEFNGSPYGGPTTYAILSAAAARGIPTAYLRAEGLLQYGYGRRQVRGVSTTFSTDSQLDSGFTTRKDDCKAFLGRLGFPVPKGDVVTKLAEAAAVAEEIGYPGAIKPLGGHKGIGVTVNVRDEGELGAAFARAGGGAGEEVIVETSLAGSDFRLLCVNGRFVAALERRPPWVEGDGVATVEQLIDRENATPARADSPVSPMGKIIKDEAMIACIEQQGYTRQSISAPGAVVVLRKVADLSAGGVSIDVTPSVHVDNIVLAQEVARPFRLTCLGIDVMAEDLSRSWKEGGFGIIEMNAAPGVFMHVNPAKGKAWTSPVRSSTPGSARAGPRASRSSPSTRWARSRSRRSLTWSCRASRIGTWGRSAPKACSSTAPSGRCTRTISPTSTTSCATPASTSSLSPTTVTRLRRTAWRTRATTWSSSTSPRRPRRSSPATYAPAVR